MSRTRVDNIDLAAGVASDTITVASTQVAEVTNIGDRVVYSAAAAADPLSAPTERVAPGETVVLTADFKLASPVARCKAQVKFVTPSVPASVVSKAEGTSLADTAGAGIFVNDDEPWFGSFFSIGNRLSLIHI